MTTTANAYEVSTDIADLRIVSFSEAVLMFPKTLHSSPSLPIDMIRHIHCDVFRWILVRVQVGKLDGIRCCIKKCDCRQWSTLKEREEDLPGGTSASEDFDASSTRSSSRGTERVLPPATDAVTFPCATYTRVDAEEDELPALAVTVTLYVLSAVKERGRGMNTVGSELLEYVCIGKLFSRTSRKSHAYTN